MTGVYKLTNPDGKIYIGASTNIAKRVVRYERKTCHRQVLVYESLLKYGYENHILEVIEECAVEILNERERYWQEYYNVIGENGLNLILVETKDKKRFYSEQTRLKMSLIQKGKQAGEKNPMYGKKRPEVSAMMSTMKCKKIINIETGEVFPSLIEASKTINISRHSLSNRLIGRTKNKTPMRYFNPT